MIDAIQLFLDYPFMRRALLAALAVAILAAVLGVYVVLRGLSLLGDGLAHISLTGVALGFVLGIYPLLMALVAAIVGAVLIQTLRSREVVRGDTAIGILFTAGLALGILIISQGPGTGVALESYLFGNILAVSAQDVTMIAVVAAVLLATFALLHKEMLYVTFNEEAARLSGLPVGVLNVVFTVVTAASIVVAARVVGVLLVSALLVVPAATSLQLARSFRGALLFSVIAGVASVLVGVLAAAQYGTPTGASIALASNAVFGATVLAKSSIERLARA